MDAPTHVTRRFDPAAGPRREPPRGRRALAVPSVVVAEATIYLTSIHRRRARGRAGMRPRRWVGFAVATAAVWVGLAFVWLVLVSATVSGECSYDEVRCSPAAGFLSDYGAYGFLAVVPLALLMVRWAIPVRPRRRSR